MMIIPYVCADFYDRNRNLIHRITPADLGKFNYPPESIKEDPLYQMLVDDGSIRTPEEKSEQRALENDPYAGITAEGKQEKPKAEKPKAETKTKTNAKASVQTEAKVENKTADNPAETKTK